MRRTGNRLLLLYCIIAHAVLAFLYWQNRNYVGVLESLQRYSNKVYENIIFNDNVRICESDPFNVYLIGDSIISLIDMADVPNNIVNLGVAGDTSSGVVYRVGRYVFLGEAKAILMHVGINDILQNNVDATIDNIKNLAEYLSSNGPIFISSVLPVRDLENKVFINRQVVVLNQQVKEFCVSSESCVYIDVWSSLVDDNGELQDRYDNGDGVHLNDDGYRVFLNRLNLYVKGLERGI